MIDLLKQSIAVQRGNSISVMGGGLGVCCFFFFLLIVCSVFLVYFINPQRACVRGLQ